MEYNIGYNFLDYKLSNNQIIWLSSTVSLNIISLWSIRDQAQILTYARQVFWATTIAQV